MGRAATFLAGFVTCAVLLACGHAGINAKVYYLDADQGGLVRKQDNEVKPFKDAQGYRCTSPQDFDAILNMLKSCLSGNGPGAIPAGVATP